MGNSFEEMRTGDSTQSLKGWEHLILDFGLGDCLCEPVSGENFPSVEGDWRKWDAPIAIAVLIKSRLKIIGNI
jgi:hypothetical protein